jgi:rhamnosyltransferase
MTPQPPSLDCPRQTVCAVVVTYNADLVKLTALLERLSEAVMHTVVVDNGSAKPICDFIQTGEDTKIKLLALGQNTGIGHAQNTGIAHAVELGAQHILLLDQDSSIDEKAVEQLYRSLVKLNNNGALGPVAAVGPMTIDSHGRCQFFVSSHSRFLRYWIPTPHQPLPEWIETPFLIASGSLVDLAAMKTIGGMRSDYFIDHVDREWCFRACAAGFRLYGIPAAILKHDVGNPTVLSWMGLTMKIGAQKPVRSYYNFRNVFLMFNDVQVPLRWKIFFIFRLTRNAIGSVTFMPRRIDRLKYIALGIYDGLQGTRGRFDLRS